jgi:hypothetical protein
MGVVTMGETANPAAAPSVIVFTDTETFALARERRQIWEAAAIRRKNGADTESRWFVRLDDLNLGLADPEALRIGRFYERHPEMGGTGVARTAAFVAAQVERLTRGGAVLVGDNPSFDEHPLHDLLVDNNRCPSWHYRPVCVTTLIAGLVGATPPYNSTEMSRAIGIDPDLYDRHTAMGDTRWVRDKFDRATALGAQTGPVVAARVKAMQAGGPFPANPGDTTATVWRPVVVDQRGWVQPESALFNQRTDGVTASGLSIFLVRGDDIPTDGIVNMYWRSNTNTFKTWKTDFYSYETITAVRKSLAAATEHAAHLNTPTTP